MYQMIELADQVKRRGGTPLDPLDYKKRYLDRLWMVIRDRVEGLRAGKYPPEKYLVPGSRPLLEPCASAACGSTWPAAPTRST